jgi:hypothetical protein
MLSNFLNNVFLLDLSLETPQRIFKRLPLMNMNLRHYTFPGKLSIIVRARDQVKATSAKLGPITFAAALMLAGRVYDESLVCPEAYVTQLKKAVNRGR